MPSGELEKPRLATIGVFSFQEERIREKLDCTDAGVRATQGAVAEDAK